MTGLNFSTGEMVKKVLLGSGISAGAVVSYELLEIAKREPELLKGIVSWGPLFAIAVIGLVMLDRNFGQMIQLGRDNVMAQQQMATAMQNIAQKDDRQAEKLETLTSYSALQSEKVLNHLDTQSERLTQHGYMLAQIAEVLRTRMGAVVETPAVPGVSDGVRAKGANA